MGIVKGIIPFTDRGYGGKQSFLPVKNSTSMYEVNMIFDKWENLSNLHFSEQWDAIISEVLPLRQKNLKEGRYDLCHGAYLNIMRFHGKAGNVYEAHRHFVDIHFVIKGGERIDIAFAADIENEKAYGSNNVYGEDRDVIFYTKTYAPHAHVHLDTTSFLLAMPSDAHAPCITSSRAEQDGRSEYDGKFEMKEENLKGIIKIPTQWI